MDNVCIETSIVSHATARPSSDLATAAMQDQARRWMAEQRPKYVVVTSQLVLAEAARGSPDAAARRLAMLADIPILTENPDIDRVADELIARSLIPARARVDALHLAIAALAGVQYLLTLNCRHFAHASVLPGCIACSETLGSPGFSSARNGIPRRIVRCLKTLSSKNCTRFGPRSRRNTAITSPLTCTANSNDSKRQAIPLHNSSNKPFDAPKQ
jgi:predicted nucleic acid-binding protein